MAAAARRTPLSIRPLPLRYRLPNPPPVFVGRAAEREALVRAIGRAPVAVVCGMGGIGKSALVCHTIHRDFADRASRTVHVAMRAGDSIDQVRVEVLRVLAAARDAGPNDGDWTGALKDPEALVAAAIDLAEQGAGMWVVVDDVHHAEAEAMRAWLRQLASYARASRWIATSRVDPAMPEIAGQVVPVGPLSEDELAELARGCDASLDEDRLRRMVERASGSPWWLRRQLAGDADESDEQNPAHGLQGEPAELLEALSVVELPCAPETIARFAPAPSETMVAELERRGLVERSADTLRVHDVARSQLRAKLSAARARDVARRAADALESLDSAAVVEAVRLWLEADRVDRADALLSRRSDDVFCAGYAPRVWQMLAPHASMRAWRLRCAAELASGPALEWAMSIARPDDERERLAWTTAIVSGGRYAEAAQEAAALAASADAGVAFDAALLQARVRLTLGLATEAIEPLRALLPATAGEALVRDAYLARALVSAAQYAPAIDLADDLGRRAAGAPAAIHRAVQSARANVYLATGRLRTAEETLSSGDSLVASPVQLATLGSTAIERGRLAEAVQCLDRADALTTESHALRVFTAWLRLRARVVAGDLARIEDDLASLCDRVERTRYGDQYPWVRIEMLRAAILRGNARLPPWPDEIPAPTGPTTLLLAAYEHAHALRHGAPAPPLPERGELPDVTDARCAWLVTSADAAVIAGDAERGASIASEAIDLARSAGLVVLEAEGLCALADALVIAGRAAEVAPIAESLSAIAEAIPSARLRADASLLRSIASDAAPDGALLERLATLDDVAPVAARRARAVLDADSARAGEVDAIDRLVLSAIARGPWSAWRFDRVDAQSNGASAWRPGWGLDESRRGAWLPDGRRLDPSDQQWRLLDAIARRGGAISREDLARDALGVREWHKLRDANRLKVAVHRARELLEDAPSRPERLVTHADGYALSGGPIRRLVTAR